MSRVAAYLMGFVMGVALGILGTLMYCIVRFRP
jgi:hypothetical protein